MPGRPRKSLEHLVLTGQFRRDRHADRQASADDPLGPPPRHLSPEARKAWREAAAAAPWLRRPDRGLLETLAQLLAQARADFAGMPASKLALIANISGRLGLSPADRTRLPMPIKPYKPNPFAQFGT